MNHSSRLLVALPSICWLAGCGGGSDAASVPAAPVPVPVPMPTSYVVDFSQEANLAKFRVSDWYIADLGTTFSPANVALENGELVLTLTQTLNPDGSVSNSGGEVSTVREFSYGTFEWVARMASANGVPVSGNVSAVFLYKVDSSSGFATEIDFEQRGDHPTSIDLTTWERHALASRETNSVPLAGQFDGYHTYAFSWQPSAVTFTIDGVVVQQFYRYIGSIQPVPAFINLWGTNSPDWGGNATAGTVRMYVKSFRYTPAG
jgi:beta-glucanase (GH16 family)